MPPGVSLDTFLVVVVAGQYPEGMSGYLCKHWRAAGLGAIWQPSEQTADPRGGQHA